MDRRASRRESKANLGIDEFNSISLSFLFLKNTYTNIIQATIKQEPILPPPQKKKLIGGR